MKLQVRKEICATRFKVENLTLFTLQLWQPYETLYGGWIMECFKKQLESIVREDVADRQALVRGNA